MINFNDAMKENIKEHNPNWPEIPDYPYRILVVEGSRSGKTNSLFNVISQQADIDKIYLYAKDPYEAKYQVLTNKRESKGSKHLNDYQVLIENSNNVDKIYKKIEYNPYKKRKILIVFDDTIRQLAR